MRLSWSEGPRCAIYTRVVGAAGPAEERRALAEQRAICAAFIARRRGWRVLPQRYDDGGCGGDHLDRPALGRLLEDIDAGSVEIVVATRVDRLCTSLLDAVRLVDRFASAGAVFCAAAPIVIYDQPILPKRRWPRVRPPEENL